MSIPLFGTNCRRWISSQLEMLAFQSIVWKYRQILNTIEPYIESIHSNLWKFIAKIKCIHKLVDTGLEYILEAENCYENGQTSIQWLWWLQHAYWDKGSYNRALYYNKRVIIVHIQEFEWKALIWLRQHTGHCLKTHSRRYDQRVLQAIQ